MKQSMDLIGTIRGFRLRLICSLRKKAGTLSSGKTRVCFQQRACQESTVTTLKARTPFRPAVAFFSHVQGQGPEDGQEAWAERFERLRPAWCILPGMLLP